MSLLFIASIFQYNFLSHLKNVFITKNKDLFSKYYLDDILFIEAVKINCLFPFYKKIKKS
jgi:hypothetical protein